MQNELLVAVIAGLGGMFGWGFADFAAKKTVDKIGSIASLVWAHLFGSILLLALLIGNFLFFGSHVVLPSSSTQWIGLAFFGTLQTVVYLLVYKGFEKGQVAILSPIFASFTGVVALLSVMFFGEVLSPKFFPALVLIFTGIILLNLDPVHLKSKRLKIIGAPGVKEVGVATVFATIWTLGWDKFTNGKDWIIYAFLMYVFMTLSAYIIAKYQKTDLKQVKKSAWKFLWLIGFGEAVAYMALSMGYSSTSFTSIIALLSGAFSLPTIILAHIFLKEKVAKIQTIGSIVIILGIILLSLR
ncbi:MAG TPA: DMT family transporter [Candidatus Saccharimonadales bacterium]|nr:DMT family transporter [Candidatus Saccharimonadales bacterium]